MKFNKLTLLEVVEPKIIQNKKRAMGRFQCDCGKIKIIEINNVKSGNTRSCGCLRIGLNVGRKHEFKKRRPHTKNRPKGLKYNWKNKNGLKSNEETI